MVLGLLGVLLFAGILAVLHQKRRDNTAGPFEYVIPAIKRKVAEQTENGSAHENTDRAAPAAHAEEVNRGIGSGSNATSAVVVRGKPVLETLPSTIAFIDVETTGLSDRDRIVSLAVLLLKTNAFETGKLNLECLHRIYNPGIRCHPDAERIHGHDDWTLRQQPFFLDEADEIGKWIGRADLVCCHNAAFDLGFINREFLHAGIPIISVPSLCTMKEYRRLHSGSASLANLSAQLGLKRSSGRHGALEDVFLTINIFFALKKLNVSVSMSELDPEKLKFQNYRTVPPLPEEPLPPRKRRPKARSAPAEASR